MRLTKTREQTEDLRAYQFNQIQTVKALYKNHKMCNTVARVVDLDVYSVIGGFKGKHYKEACKLLKEFAKKTI